MPEAMMSCQKCRTPLKLDASLQDLNSAAYDILVGRSVAKDIDSEPLLTQSKAPPNHSRSQTPPHHEPLKRKRREIDMIAQCKMRTHRCSKESSPEVNMALDLQHPPPTCQKPG